LIRVLFTQRRRKIRGVLSKYLTTHYGKEKGEILSRIDLEEKRVYELTPADFIRLSNVIAGSVKAGTEAQAK
jgi:16S rRNA A1518/A1519 N6-dimethyltransferase RsmA/KsgA/DIM1 with predicted DNA glycosylase/AP lyase activity